MIIAFIKRLFNALHYALQGLFSLIKTEFAFQLECFASLIIVPLAFYLGANRLERAVLIFVWLLVPIVEAINSAIEAAVDFAGKEQHPLAGRAKDRGAAAVFLSLLVALFVWILILVK